MPTIHLKRYWNGCLQHLHNTVICNETCESLAGNIIQSWTNSYTLYTFYTLFTQSGGAWKVPPALKSSFILHTKYDIVKYD